MIKRIKVWFQDNGETLVMLPFCGLVGLAVLTRMTGSLTFAILTIIVFVGVLAWLNKDGKHMYYVRLEKFSKGYYAVKNFTYKMFKIYMDFDAPQCPRAGHGKMITGRGWHYYCLECTKEEFESDGNEKGKQKSFF